jgi:RNA polymerase sigma factor (sigma-70 family)
MAAPLLFLNTDARILELIRKGDEEALATLYSTSRRLVASFVSRNSGTFDDAEDVLQEALIILWERVRSGKFEYSSRLSTFLLGTAKNIWLQRLRRARREIRTEVDPDATADDSPTALNGMIDEEDTQRVRAAMDRLGEPCRKLLLLFYWEELPLEEIATQLGFANASTVKSKKYQCKKALERLVRND